MPINSIKPSSPSIVLDSNLTSTSGPKPGLTPKPTLQVSPTQLQNILAANGGSSAAASFKAGSSGTNNPGTKQTTTSAGSLPDIGAIVGSVVSIAVHAAL